ncbi:MAG: hypothetical protein J7J25_03490 [Candidatus Omnitrophica bacterium]|nr:hypothetical protein [Candidatus Omnitrophota bacterium]
MPIYCYRAKEREKSCEYCRQGFEIFEKKRAVLKYCPRCGNEVVKVYAPFSVGFSRSGFDQKAKEKGFHKLKRVDKGKYEKIY